MKKLNQKGFSALELILIIVIVGLLAGVGFYVYKAKQDSSKSLDNATNNVSHLQDKAKIDKQADALAEKSSWFIYKPPGGEYSIKIPDGWTLHTNSDGDSTYLYTICNGFDANCLTYKTGTKATVGSRAGNGEGPYRLLVKYLPDGEVDRLISGKKQGTIKAVNTTGDKYYYVLETEEGSSAPKGTKEYGYIFNDGKDEIQVLYNVYPSDQDQHDLIENMLATLDMQK